MKGNDDHKGEVPETGTGVPEGTERNSILMLFRRGVAGLIRGYQRFISPALPSSCRFTPTCSEYTRRAIIKYGVLKGGWLGTKRILKCHPFHPGGEDPVP